MKKMLFSLSFLLSPLGRRALRVLCLSLVLLFSLLSETFSQRPLSRTPIPFGKCYQYFQKYSLTSDQQRYCKYDHELFKSVMGVGLNLQSPPQQHNFEEECQYWMAPEQWNCTGIKPPIVLGQMEPYVHHLTRETAYVQSLLSALLFIKVARGCTMGTFSSCSCMGAIAPAFEPLESGKSWDACMDDTHTANAVTQDFLDDMWNTASTPVEQRLVQIHNLEAGRRAVTSPDNYRTVCRCHGMTRDCITKTCYKKVQSPRVISEYIKKELYRKAEKVALVDNQKGAELFTVESLKPNPATLIFTEDSPDYCTGNFTEYGALPVSGRECVQYQPPYHHHRFGICSRICCDGFRTVVSDEEYICRCTMNDCHTKCRRKVVRHFCK